MVEACAALDCLQAEKAVLQKRLEQQVGVGRQLGVMEAGVSQGTRRQNAALPSHPSRPLLLSAPAPQHAEMAADKEHELAKVTSEKNASLESLVRATAAATAEAGRLVSRLGGALLAPAGAAERLWTGQCLNKANPPGRTPPLQNEAHEAAKAQLVEAAQQAEALQGDLSSLQAQLEAACSAKAELIKEKGQLEKRVRCQGPAAAAPRPTSPAAAPRPPAASSPEHCSPLLRLGHPSTAVH